MMSPPNLRLPLRLGVPVAALLALLLPARAEPADELVGLFMQSCIPYAGNPAGLREWTTKNGLPILPPQAQAMFVPQRNGTAFDASSPTGHFVLLAGDTGVCSALAESGDGAAIAADLQGAFNAAGMTATLTRDADDPLEKRLHHREWTVRKGERAWHVVLSTSDEPGTHPMLTAIPQ